MKILLFILFLISTYKPSVYHVESTSCIYLYKSFEQKIIRISIPIELMIYNNDSHDLILSTWRCYKTFMFGEKSWSSDLDLYEKNEDSLIWIGENHDIYKLSGFQSKKYVTYINYNTSKDTIAQKIFMEYLQNYSDQKIAVDVKRLKSEQRRYLQCVFDTDSIFLKYEYPTINEKGKLIQYIDRNRVIK